MRRLLQTLSSADKRASAWFAQLGVSHRELYVPSAWLAHSGDGLIVLLVGLAAYVLGAASLRQDLQRTATAVAIVAILVALLKFALQRERPQGEESALWSATPEFDRYAFPSGHAARVMCVALVMGATLPLWRTPLLLWSIAVGLARVVVGAHHLLDVAGGWLLGIMVASLVRSLWAA